MRTAGYRIISRFLQLLPVAFILAAVAGCGAQPPQIDSLTVTPTAAPATDQPLPTEFSTATPSAAETTPDPTPTPEGNRGPGLQALTELPLEPATGFEPAPDRDLYQLAKELSWPPGSPDVSRVVNPEPVSFEQGRKESFWLIRFLSLEVYQAEFELRLVTDRAYWYIEEGIQVDQGDLERGARDFEQNIYPKLSETFGRERSPGVDNDPHLNIIHARLQGVGGYFSSSDEQPQEVYPYSNERESIYINIGYLPVGSSEYLEVLAHELQHAIHWNSDPNEETWINEGLSELAVAVAGYKSSNTRRFLRSSNVSLIHWPLDQKTIGAHYGAASLFMRYLAEHYGPVEDIRRLVTDPADGLAGIDSFLAGGGHGVTSEEVLRDWIVANILNEGEGKYGYQDLDRLAEVDRAIDSYREFTRKIPQYAADYTKLRGFEQPLWLQFSGPVENVLIPAEVDQVGCWWSNSGDSINSTLSRKVDLTGINSATLRYQLWYEVEEDWDYGYVQVSLNLGKSWKILETPETSPRNPIGNGFGSGYTGESRGWVNQTVDLTPFVGSEVLLRFQYVTDDAVNGIGLCIRYISIPEVKLEVDDAAWQPAGFIRINNRVRQDYIVQVILVGKENRDQSREESRVLQMPLDQANHGELIIKAPQDYARIVVAVMALAPGTVQRASYTLTLGPVN